MPLNAVFDGRGTGVKGPLLFLQIALVLGPSVVAARQDDLEPSEGVFSRAGSSILYHDAVAKGLVGEHERRQCQLVVRPSFEREWAVYILREDGSPTTVVFKRFREQLWREMLRLTSERGIGAGVKTEVERQRAVLAVLKPKVDRWAAPISKPVADTLEEVWWRMLGRTRYPRKVRGGEDGGYYSFASWRGDVGSRSGEVWSPADGSRTGALVALGEQMAELAQAPSTKKEQALGIAARRLLARLRP